MFEKIRNAFVILAVLCLVCVPAAHASPAQYVDELGQGWSQLLDFFDSLVAAVWINSEGSEESPPDTDPPGSPEDGSDGDDGSGDDGGDGSPEFGPIVDPIG